MHAKRSSFYLVAKRIRPQSLAARAAVEGWKRDWYVATFGTAEECAQNRAASSTKEKVDKVLEEFGEELCRLAEPVWAVQEEALRKINEKGGWSSRPKTVEHAEI
jgi:hypothetical protein